MKRFKNQKENSEASQRRLSVRLSQLDDSALVPQDPRDEPASELLARIRTTREQADADKQAAKKMSERKSKK